MGEVASSSSHKPHFFQPILHDPSSALVLSIPKAFQRDHLVGREDGEGVATLKSQLKSWKVKLNDFEFTDGWTDFFKAHKLSMGNVLVFEYQGHDLIFDVWIFDLGLGCCEVQYSTPPLMSEGNGENEMQNGQRGAEGMDVESKGKGIDIDTDFREVIEIEDSEEFPDDGEFEEVNEDENNIFDYPYFVATLRSYNIGRSFLVIPSGFSRANIPDDVEVVILKDEKGKEWPIKLTRCKDTYGVRFGCGWYKFGLKKRLKEGDVCLFEQENTGEMEFKVSIIRRS